MWVSSATESRFGLGRRLVTRRRVRDCGGRGSRTGGPSVERKGEPGEGGDPGCLLLDSSPGSLGQSFPPHPTLQTPDPRLTDAGPVRGSGKGKEGGAFPPHFPRP